MPLTDEARYCNGG